MIGKVLESLIEEKNTNVNELARKIGVSPQTLYGIIRRDNMKVDFSVLLKICEELNVSIDVFYKDYIKTKSSIIFSPEEESIIKKYRLLNQEGQERLKTSLDDFLLIDKYLVHTEDKDLPAETKAAHQEIYQKRLEDEAAKQREIDDLVAKIKAGSKGKVRLIAKGGFNTVMEPVKTPEEIAELIRKYKAGELKEEE